MFSWLPIRSNIIFIKYVEKVPRLLNIITQYKYFFNLDKLHRNRLYWDAKFFSLYVFIYPKILITIHPFVAYFLSIIYLAHIFIATILFVDN